MLVAIALTPILPVVTTALITLETIRRGATQGALSATAGITGVLVFGVLSSADLYVMAMLSAITFLAGVLLGSMVRWAGSLTLAFQGILLLCVIVVLAALFIWPDPSALIGAAVNELVEIFRSSGATEEQLDLVRSWNRLFFGIVVTALFSQLAAALLLGVWWNCFDGLEGQFGEEFRALRLGRVLGIPATLLMASSLIVDATLIQNLFPLALFGFWFQGLAVSHAWAKAKQWHPAVLVVAYLLLVTPFTGLIILAMGSIGLVDNWIDLRAPIYRAA